MSRTNLVTIIAESVRDEMCDMGMITSALCLFTSNVSRKHASTQ